jgi:3-hydroxyisobutyrate dehydrogenase
MPIGFCGLGRMGTAMAHRLLDWTRTGRLDRTPDKSHSLVDRRAHVARLPKELVSQAEPILAILSDDEAVEDVSLGAEGLLAGSPAGKLFIEMSTFRPATVRRLAQVASDQGAAFVECPVSGTVAPARDGKLLGIAGGARLRSRQPSRCSRYYDDVA